jgi:hypothetical protein
MKKDDPTFAKNSSVPVMRTQQEIQRTVTRYGATGFMYGNGNGKAAVIFEMKNRRIKFLLDLPRSESAKDKQLERTRWRCLLLAIKAKLECVHSGISTFEQEFLAHIVMPNGRTVGEEVAPAIEQAYRSGNMPLLLGPGPA